MKNKKADGKIISVYWFVVLVIVVGGIVMMVNLYYNAPYDVREAEANLLAEKVANCIYFGGEMNPDLISSKGILKEEFRDNFLDRCSIDITPSGQWVKTQYYIGVDFYSFLNEKKSIFNISEGNSNAISDCKLKGKKYEKLVVCSEKEFYVKGIAQEKYLVKILTVVRKTEQNVK